MTKENPEKFPTKRRMTKQTRAKLSEARKAAWATRRAKAAELEPPPPTPTRDRAIVTTFDRVTANNHAMAISRAINHLTDYQRKLELDGYIGHPGEVERTILHLGDVGRLFRGE